MRQIEEIVPPAILFALECEGYLITKKKMKKGDYTPEFEVAVWKPYRHPANCSKLKAFRAWEGLTRSQQLHVIAVIPVAVHGFAGREDSKVPHLSSWLNGHYFETLQAPVTRPLEALQSAVDWANVMRLYNMTSNWKADIYGPPPGRPGCRVPAELVGEMM